MQRMMNTKVHLLHGIIHMFWSSMLTLFSIFDSSNSFLHAWLIVTKSMIQGSSMEYVGNQESMIRDPTHSQEISTVLLWQNPITHLDRNSRLNYKRTTICSGINKLKEWLWLKRCTNYMLIHIFLRNLNRLKIVSHIRFQMSVKLGSLKIQWCSYGCYVWFRNMSYLGFLHSNTPLNFRIKFINSSTPKWKLGFDNWELNSN